MLLRSASNSVLQYFRPGLKILERVEWENRLDWRGEWENRLEKGGWENRLDWRGDGRTGWIGERRMGEQVGLE